MEQITREELDKFCADYDHYSFIEELTKDNMKFNGSQDLLDKLICLARGSKTEEYFKLTVELFGFIKD